MSDNYVQSYNRLQSLATRLKKEPELLAQYDQIIQEQLQSGIIEKVPDSELSNHEDAHFLPHHGVLRSDRTTTKLRIVYDGSAKCPETNQSINDCLETGPNFIPDLFDILLKFRNGRIGITADIEKAFLMIGITAEDRDKLRFLWFKDATTGDTTVTQFRFKRLVFGLRPSPSILGATLNYHLDQYTETKPDIVNKLKESLFVDDFVTSVDHDEEAKELCHESKNLLANGGFNLRKWKSNSSQLLTHMSPEEKPRHNTTLHSHAPDPNVTEPDTKVLGMNWDSAQDEFFFSFKEVIEYAHSLPPTKRSLLKLSAKLFDPLGFLTPFTVRYKILFQELCKQKVDWDEDLSGELLHVFKSFKSELCTLTNISIPRCYFHPTQLPLTVQLHGFSDASQNAYGAVVFLRTTYQDGSVIVSQVASKSKVAPMKKQSIPRLELLGATILARLVHTINNALSLPAHAEIFYWVDSMSVLCWIRNTRPWKQYVQTRVQEILSVSERSQWNFCPGNINPADLPSRGMKAEDLKESTLWWNGPEFLSQDSSAWPTVQSPSPLNDNALSEMLRRPTTVTHVLLNIELKPFVNIGKIINIERFSNKRRLLRVTAYVIKFISHLKSSVQT